MISLGLAVGVSVGVVLFVGALALLVLLGMRRYGFTLPSRLDQPIPPAGGAGPGGEEMEWDNSALNIIVNPLETECTYEEEGEPCSGQKVVFDACRDDETEEEEEKEETKCPDVKELEWDDSTLSY